MAKQSSRTSATVVDAVDKGDGAILIDDDDKSESTGPTASSSVSVSGPSLAPVFGNKRKAEDTSSEIKGAASNFTPWKAAKPAKRATNRGSDNKWRNKENPLVTAQPCVSLPPGPCNIS